MNKSRKKIIKTIATDDAKWDKCFIDLRSVGVKTNSKFTAYDPPKDLTDKAEYDRNWKTAKAE